MPSHYFHCTNGEDALFDERGRKTHRADDLRDTAEAVARGLMRSLRGYPDWSSWMVCVYDDEGRCVEEVPFPRPAARPVPAAKRTGTRRPTLVAA